MKIGYFFDGSAVLEKAYEDEQKLKLNVFLYAGCPIIVMTIIMMLIIPFCIDNSTSKITRGIIHLYEQLDEFLRNQHKTKTNQLTFKKSAHELNELQRTFNYVAKTTMLAQSNMKEKEKALLNYSEAYYIFKKFGD